MNNVIDISDIPIYIAGNDDIQLINLIVSNLIEKGARNVSVLVNNTHEKNINKESINAKIIPGTWKEVEDFEAVLSDCIIAISMLYHEFSNHEALFTACVRNKVVIFITWDSGMELDHLVRNNSCPRTQLHQKLLDYARTTTTTSSSSSSSSSSYSTVESSNSREYYNSSSIHNNRKSSNKMKWILFQVGLFAENILDNDISTITTAFNSPSQYIFVNVSVKSDFAKIIAETIVDKKVLPDRNYVVGEFVSHTFLGHVYKVFNDGLEFDNTMNYKITDYETTNQLRINGIISPQPMPRILYPDCDSYMQKLCVEISFQFEAVIYKILENSHKQETLKDWVSQKIQERILNSSTKTTPTTNFTTTRILNSSTKTTPTTNFTTTTRILNSSTKTTPTTNFTTTTTNLTTITTNNGNENIEEESSDNNNKSNDNSDSDDNNSNNVNNNVNKNNRINNDNNNNGNNNDNKNTDGMVFKAVQ